MLATSVVSLAPTQRALLLEEPMGVMLKSSAALSVDNADIVNENRESTDVQIALELKRIATNPEQLCLTDGTATPAKNDKNI